MKNELRMGTSSSSGVAYFWSFDRQTQGTVHGLVFEYDSASNDAPLKYIASDSTPMAMTESEGAVFTLDLAPTQDISTATVAASVVTPITAATWDSGYRAVSAYLRYDDAASILLYHDTYNAPDNFSIVAPQLQGSSIVLAASAGDFLGSAYSAVYKDYVTPGTTDVTLSIPEPPDLQYPTPGATGITVGSKVRYSSSTGGVHDVTLTDQWSTWIRIVTTDQEVTIPESKTGFVLPALDDVRTYVIKHNDFATVDEATGVINRFSNWDPFDDELEGTKRGDGSFSTTPSHLVTTVSPAP